MLENKQLLSTTEDYEKTLATHKTFLSKFKVLPDKTRKATYKQLLMLPNNYGHLQQLTKPYPVLPEHGFNKQLAIVVDMLGRLYPDLKNQWIPSMIHPFVKLFEEDFTFSFQSSLCFLLNWLKPVLLDFPNANKQIMEIFEEILPNLKQKVQSLDYPLSSLINPIFVVTLTDVLNKKDWLQIFDFLVTNPFQPWHYISVAAALVSLYQRQLQKLKSIEEMSLALRKQKNISMQAVVKKSREISNQYKRKYLQIYKDSIFPIQEGRYPVHKFFRTPIRKTNSKLDQQDDIQMSQIKSKYKQLEAMLQKLISSSHTSDNQAIQNKYQMVEGQVRQYLNLIKQEHANKMKALKEVESKFNAQLQAQGQQRAPKMGAIQKRARLQRQIETVIAESESIKQMQDQMMKRVQESLKIKKNELQKINEELKNR